MTELFNKKSEKEKRRYLRKNITLAEKIIWLNIRRKEIEGERFLRQFSIKHYVLDFYCPKLRLAIEIDGETHLTEEELEYDIQRQDYLESLGIIFLRFRNEGVFNNADVVIEKIKLRVRELQEKNPPLSSLS
ncbi:MAG: endonuclease domain-containing protein [Ignavibacteria bacterium]|nr:endonuclease domain-containing protein [Ignavibacteria bacterium]